MRFFLATSNKKRGLTIVEVVVATGLFSTVMLVGVGALLSVLEANRKAQSIQSVTNNIYFALENISRSARVGTHYHCSSSQADPPPVSGNIGNPSDCSNGGKLFAFESFGGDTDDDSDQVIYRLNGTSLERSTDGGGNFIAITAPEVTVDRFEVFVTGAQSTSDALQARAVLLLGGTVSTSVKSTTEFNVQTSVTQRIPDI